MWLEEYKLYYQTLIETTTKDDKYDVESGSLKILCTSEFEVWWFLEFDGDLQFLMMIYSF